MSPSSDPPKLNTLVVEASAPAEISVLDGSANTVARSVGRLSKELPSDIYKVRIRVGPTVEEKIVALDRDQELRIDASPDLYSPIPLANTSRSHGNHQEMARRVSETFTQTLGKGASVLVVARVWSRLGHSAPINPAEGLTFSSESSSFKLDLGKLAEREFDGDPIAAWSAEVAPGSYRLQRAGVTRTIIATSNQQTQAFLLQRSASSQGAQDKAKLDIGDAAISISPRQSFDPNSEQTWLAEVARYALTQKRKILSPDVLDQILRAKFDAPMLGLLGAHLLLRDEPDNVADFETVTGNLLNILGSDHPDVRALFLARATPSPMVPRHIASPPMLRASWDLAVAHSLVEKDVFPEESEAGRLSALVLPGSPWLLWKGSATVEGTTAADKRLEETLQDFFAARSRADIARSNAANPFRSRLNSTFRTLAHGLDVVRGTASTVRNSMPELSLDEKGELTKVLGIPASKLDTMLRKLFP
ncbi:MULTISPECIES: hypothetical protein [unclassified Bradyrhizobium]|uniref:hypothetical protein n=1 Tax=unclassified Bradyrhizobium TaxID=2631580 RepID=UPI001FF922D3|nr:MULTISPECIES: hypothetical protein [unclassified Bradyrhizobium]MCK1412375.1 hypothetical protein [Bradyrhizobium sp. CW4]UPJ26536.1 hypothetical protein IVB54_33500 [Bradyrhizobium sp. CW1]